MNVPEETKQKYLDSSVDKQLLITFPDLNEGQGLNISMEQILFETMSLKESILENSSIEFVGCIASEFSISLYGVREDLKGQRIIVNIQAGNTDPIRLFYGIVDSVEMEANHNKRKITAYDMLYTVGNIEVAKWYKELIFPKNGMTLKAFRTSLFDYIDEKLRQKYPNTNIGVIEKDVVLPCDGIKIKKRYRPSTLQSIVVIKALCQINGVFGMMSRLDINGMCQFEYRILTQTDTKEGSFPGTTLYPPFIPGFQYTGDKPSQYVAYYRSVDYQEFTVKPVDSITIRQSDTDDGYTYRPPDVGEDANTYIIQGNMFTYKLPTKDLQYIASNIFQNVSNFSYQPFESESNGLPWLECGIDGVSYYTYDYEEQEYIRKNFFIFSREIKGLQSIKDNYSAEGEQDQRLFISDVHSQIDIINQKIEDVEVDMSDYYNKEEINEMFEQFEPGTEGWSVESVSSLPTHGEPQVLYLVQGEVVVN